MALDLEEQEQVAALQAWWKQYGKLALVGVTVAVLGTLGWQGWQLYQNRQAEAAANSFHSVEKAWQGNEKAKLNQNIDSLLSQYPNSAQAPRAALLAAKYAAEAQDWKNAHDKLTWVIAHASESELKALASLQLANVQVAQGQLDAALQTLTIRHNPGFDALAEELRGDIFVLKKQPAEAAKAYTLALQKIGTDNNPAKQLLEMKKDALGEPTK